MLNYAGIYNTVKRNIAWRAYVAGTNHAIDVKERTDLYTTDDYKNFKEWYEKFIEDKESLDSYKYEYEALVTEEYSKNSPFEVGSWIPVSADRIKDPNKISEYIEKGLLRKIK